MAEGSFLKHNCGDLGMHGFEEWAQWSASNLMRSARQQGSWKISQIDHACRNSESSSRAGWLALADSATPECELMTPRARTGVINHQL